MNRPVRSGSEVRADSGVHESEAFPGSYQEATHLDSQQAVLVEELRVLLPILFGLVEQQRRRSQEASIRNAAPP